MIKKLLAVFVIGFTMIASLSTHAVDQSIKQVREFRQLMAKVDAIFGTDRGSDEEIELVKQVANAVLQSDSIQGANNFRQNESPVFIRFIKKSENQADKAHFLQACKKASKEKIPAYIIAIHRDKWDGKINDLQGLRSLILSMDFNQIKLHEQKRMGFSNPAKIAAIVGTIGIAGTSAVVGYRAWQKKPLKDLAMTALKGVGITMTLGGSWIIEHIFSHDYSRFLGKTASDVLWNGKRIA